MSHFTIKSGLLATAGCCLALAAPLVAHAQANGTYSGTQANGQAISVTVSTDATTGLPEVTGVGVTIGGTCKPSGTTVQGWGYGPGVDIKKDKANSLISTGYLYSKMTYVFSGNMVTGMVTSYTPVFAPFTTKPAKALFCASPLQSYSATLGAAMAPGARSGAPQAVLFH